MTDENKTPEQVRLNTTEYSNNFLSGWTRKLMIIFYQFGIANFAYDAGVNFVHGKYYEAIYDGALVASALAVNTLLIAGSDVKPDAPP